MYLNHFIYLGKISSLSVKLCLKNIFGTIGYVDMLLDRISSYFENVYNYKVPLGEVMVNKLISSTVSTGMSLNLKDAAYL